LVGGAAGPVGKGARGKCWSGWGEEKNQTGEQVGGLRLNRGVGGEYLLSGQKKGVSTREEKDKKRRGFRGKGNVTKGKGGRMRFNISQNKAIKKETRQALAEENLPRLKRGGERVHADPSNKKQSILVVKT